MPHDWDGGASVLWLHSSAPKFHRGFFLSTTSTGSSLGSQGWTPWSISACGCVVERRRRADAENGGDGAPAPRMVDMEGAPGAAQISPGLQGFIKLSLGALWLIEEVVRFACFFGLQDRRTNPSYSRRASLVYTPAPAKKGGELKSAKTPQTAPAKKRRDTGGDAGKEITPDSNGDNGSVASMVLPGPETKPKDTSDIGALREQIDELQKQLLEKEEALRCAESTVSEMNAVYSTIDELRRQVAEKEALIKYNNSQLHNVKAMQSCGQEG